MGELATLITAIAALVTAAGSVTTGIILALSSLNRQRLAAAREAAQMSVPGLDARHRRRDDDEFTADLGRAAAELARDAGELARESVREERFTHLEHPEYQVDPPAGGDANV